MEHLHIDSLGSVLQLPSLRHLLDRRAGVELTYGKYHSYATSFKLPCHRVRDEHYSKRQASESKSLPSKTDRIGERVNHPSTVLGFGEVSLFRPHCSASTPCLNRPRCGLRVRSQSKCVE